MMVSFCLGFSDVFGSAVGSSIKLSVEWSNTLYLVPPCDTLLTPFYTLSGPGQRPAGEYGLR